MTRPEPSNQTTRALIALRQKILSGELAGGTRLLEVPLTEMLGISRTPVREAMSRLAEEGLLDRARGGGFEVRAFAFADALDAIELRGVLEGMAARLAAERGADPAPLAEVADALDTCFHGAAVDFERYGAENARFHAALARLPGSVILERELERAARLPFASPSAFVPDGARIDAFGRTLVTAQEQHRALIEAIAAREGARAEALAREHTRAARRNLEYVFSEERGLIGALPGLSLVTE